jgi:hypothetical protein
LSSFLVFVTPFTVDNALNMPWNGLYPRLDLYLWEVLPALPPSCFCLAMWRRCPLLCSLSLKMWPGWLNGIKIWRISTPD